MAAEDRRALAERIAQRTLHASKAQETEILISGGREALTRFAGNSIHQNLTRSGLEISVRAADEGRTGRASTSRSDEGALAETSARALEIARRLEPQPDLPTVPEPFESYPSTRCWDEATSAASPEQRARAVGEIVAVASSGGLAAAGSFASNDRFEAVANSRGLFAYGEYTSSALSMTMTGPEQSTGYAEDGSHAIGVLDVETLARRAVDKALVSANPGEVPPGEYTTILEPIAVVELLYNILYGNSCCHLSGLAMLEGQSYFSGKKGQKVFGENITLRDDLFHASQWGIPFDAEGVPKKALTMIDKGVVRDFTYDRASARKSGVEPTGHGLPVPNTYGSVPQNVVLDGGNTTVDEMIRKTQRGILVTRLWYIRLVDPADLIVTGLTRDGTFLIEDGKIVKGLRNYRFNQSLRAMLNQVTHLSPVSRAVAGIATPALRVEGFRFSGVVPKES